MAQGGPFCDKTVGQVMKQFELGIVKRRPRAGDLKLFPLPDSQLQDGDSVLVQGPFESLQVLTQG